MRAGDEGSTGWEGTAHHAVPALLPRPDFTLLLYCTTGAILRLILAKACTFPIPSAGPCGVGDSVLTPGTSGPQTSAYPLLQCCLGLPVAIVECRTVLLDLGRCPAHESQPWFVSSSCSNTRGPRRPCTSSPALHTHQPQRCPAPPGARARQQNNRSRSPQMCQGIFAGQGIFLLPPKGGTRIHQK